MMDPYYKDESVTLYHGDFREILPSLDLSVDLLIADPPYGETRLNWDKWPDGWPSIAAQYAQSMWCFGSMRMFLDRRDEFADWKLSQDVVWEKHNGSSMKADRFNRVHEHALFWYRGRWADVHHETPTVAEASVRRVRRQARPAHWIGATGANTYASIEGGPLLQRSVIYSRSMHGRAINETEKPEPFVRPLVDYACPPGGGPRRHLFGQWCDRDGRKAHRPPRCPVRTPRKPMRVLCPTHLPRGPELHERPTMNHTHACEFIQLNPDGRILSRQTSAETVPGSPGKAWRDRTVTALRKPIGQRTHLSAGPIGPRAWELEVREDWVLSPVTDTGESFRFTTITRHEFRELPDVTR